MQRHSGIVPKTKCMHIYTCGVRLHLSYLQVNASPSEHDVTRKTNKVTYTALRSARLSVFYTSRLVGTVNS